MSEVIQRIRVNPVSSTLPREAKINVGRARKYSKITYGVMRYPECAVVGGGPSVRNHLETLRNWKGDIFAINDMAKYLSDNGIAHYLYAIDGVTVPFRVGILTKGALFASRCHKNQFKQMNGRPIRIFDLAEDARPPRIGIEGGPTAACRAPHLLLSMGYCGVSYFGLDGSYEDDVTHVSGKTNTAYENMLIIRAGGKDYMTSSGFMLQHEWMCEAFKRYPQFLHNASGGLFPVILDDPDGWSVIAIAEDLKKKYDDLGNFQWCKEYTGKLKVVSDLKLSQRDAQIEPL